MEFIVEILSAVAWPGAILAISLMLQDDLKALLTRVEKAKVPGGGEFSFRGTNRTQLRSSSSKKASDFPDFTPNKVGNIYWLGSDLMWLSSLLVQGYTPSRKQLLHGLDQCIHHCSRVGLANSKWAADLATIRSEIEIADSIEKEARIRIHCQLQGMGDEIGFLVEEFQSDFDPGLPKT